MTCFRNTEGKTIRSLCKNLTEYGRFIRAIEKGFSTEEAFKMRTIPKKKGHEDSPTLKRIKEVLAEFNEKNYYIIKNYCRRTKSDVDTALRWAAQTGRVKVKSHKQKEFLRRKEK